MRRRIESDFFAGDPLVAARRTTVRSRALTQLMPGDRARLAHELPSDRPDRPRIRSRRVVLADGVRPAAIHMRGGIVRVAAIDDVPAACGRRCRRCGGDAGRGRHARPRERARPHRVGGLRHGVTRRRSRRRDDNRRHAAQQHSGDDDGGGSRRQAPRGGRAMLRRRRVLGRCRAWQRLRIGRSGRRGRARVSNAFSCRPASTSFPR